MTTDTVKAELTNFGSMNKRKWWWWGGGGRGGTQFSSGHHWNRKPKWSATAYGFDGREQVGICLRS